MDRTERMMELKPLEYRSELGEKADRYEEEQIADTYLHMRTIKVF